MGTARILACCTALLSFAGAAAAQTDRYPDRPVRIVVGFPPGGAADFSARILVTHLQPALGGQTIVIDNRGGAFSNIANDLVSKAAPDGYTLLITADATITISPSVYSKLPVRSAARPYADHAPHHVRQRAGAASRRCRPTRCRS